jgi:hypothetical protein
MDSALVGLRNTFANLDLIELFCLLAWVILLLPTLVYLGTTWRNRRRFLLDRLGPEEIKFYYKQFFPSSASRRFLKRRADREDIKTQFKQDFDRLYGIRHYALPLGLLAFISGIGIWVTAKSLQSWLGRDPNFKAFPAIAISAFLGAYAWVLYDQFARFRTGDFTAHDVYSGIYRFLIAIPLGISLATFLKDDVGVGVAFLLAAFPTATLFKFSRRLTSQKLGLGEGKEGGTLELEKLQCVGRSNAERYLDEGVSTIAELAWADPIDLTVRTNREFNFVIDSISQALLWVYFQDGVKKLYPLSLRGAQEVCTFLDDLDSDEPKIKRAAEQNLKTAAGLMGLEEQSFLYTLITVKDDPYAQFLFGIWA